MEEAVNKMKTGGPHALTKVIVCVGINDLRQGTSCNQITTELKTLISETRKRHSGCSILVCSVLPVNSREVDKNNTVKNLNRKFEDTCKHMPNVHYINTAAEFSSHRNIQDLFERDHIHPNQAGTTLMVNCIRQHPPHQQQVPRLFPSSRADTSERTYSQTVNSIPNHDLRLRDWSHNTAHNSGGHGPVYANSGIDNTFLANHYRGDNQMNYMNAVGHPQVRWPTSLPPPEAFHAYQPKMSMYPYPQMFPHVTGWNV